MQKYKFTNKLSAKGKIWNIKPYDENQAIALQQKFGVSDVVSKLLYIKGQMVSSTPDFLDPKLKNMMPDPNSLKDMGVAVDRIVRAIENNENIVIYGDYDVDGATSSAILRRFFDALNVKNKTYIPDRIKEGYGLNVNALTKLHETGADLVITVDCGIVSFEPISEAKKLGLDCVVIDHHLSTEILPDAVAVVNPNRFDEKTDLTNLCAAGVVFLLVIALNSKLRELGFYERNNITPPNILSYLDLVALGTVCDVMTLTGLNRAYVKQGLKIMSQRGNAGLNALCEIAEMDRKPDVYSLGFIIGPRINAGGRVGNCRLGSDLLSTNCPDTAKEIAKVLHELNKERQEIEKKSLEEANQDAEKITAQNNFLIVSNENWHPGVIGIMAGRLKEAYNKPAAVIALSNGIGKASVRSVGNVDIGRAIANAKSKGLLQNGGGHKAAGGFTVEQSKIPELQNFFNLQIEDEYKNYANDNSLNADLVLSVGALNIDLYDDLQILSPYGNGNPEPKIILENVRLNAQKIYAEKHIAYFLSQGGVSGSMGKSIKSICFNAIGTSLGDQLLSARGKDVSLLGKIKKNEWQGQENIEFIIDDIVTY